MRALADRARITRFLESLARAVHEPTQVYLVGGATAVFLGWRAATIDIDLALDPDSDAALRAIAQLKDELQVNVELASPADFIPEVPGWRDRSPWVAQFGNLHVRHYDLYAQALAKIERGHGHDEADVQAMLARGLVEPQQLRTLFAAILPTLYRFPAVNAESFAAAVDRVLASA